MLTTEVNADGRAGLLARHRIAVTFLQQGNVPAILAIGLMLAALRSFASGLVLATVARGREMKLLACLRYNAPGDAVRE